MLKPVLLLPPVIEVDHLETVIAGAVIHQDLNLAVADGEVLAIIGGSGSGKTTLMRLMLGLERPTSGEIRMFGRPIIGAGCGEDDLKQIRHRLGVLFQQGALFSALSVFDNVALPLRELKTLPRSLIEPLVLLKLSQVGLQPNDAGKMPAELSGGMIKRVALARALIMDPQLLFLDEPTAGLDPESAKQFVALIRALRRELRLTVVMVTHDVDTLLALADRVAVLADRHLVAVDSLCHVAVIPHPFITNFFLGHLPSCAEEHVADLRARLDQPAAA
jgi:phospholipid/cholesterol/gamma-HCH transport system ATP-binding protein